MNNIFEVFETNVLNYVKEHVKEIHLFTTNKEVPTEYAYVLLDDNTVISVYHYKELEFCMYLTSESERWLQCVYPKLSIRDLGDNIIDHGEVKHGTTILKLGDCNLIP